MVVVVVVAVVVVVEVVVVLVLTLGGLGEGMRVGLVVGRLSVLVMSGVTTDDSEGWIMSGRFLVVMVIGTCSVVIVLGITGSEGVGWMLNVGDAISTT